jgi:hypothetical protein
MRWVKHVACMGVERNSYIILVGKLEGKRPFGRPGDSLEDDIKMDFKETGLEGMDRISLTHDRDQQCALVSAVTNLD